MLCALHCQERTFRVTRCEVMGCSFRLTEIPATGRLLLAVLVSTSLSFGYTVLTHEAIIDSVWDTSIQKLLLQRFPDSTPEQLDQAHAYAYGGCIIQDAG